MIQPGTAGVNAAAAGTVAMLAHGVVKCATRLVMANTTTTTAISMYVRK